MKLTDATIRTAKPKDRPYKMADGGGLYLYATPTGGKLWRMAYRFAGKPKTLSFGAYPYIGLREARDQRDKAKKLLANGADPSEVKRAEKTAMKSANRERDAERLAAALKEARQKPIVHFMLNDDGVLTFRVGGHCLSLTLDETHELRAVLGTFTGEKYHEAN
jgi:hypothetical protein